MIKAVIHCSDSPQGRGDDAETIHQWHLERGWDGIGYHYVILEDGTVEAGRPKYWKGSHARGWNNALGICLIGQTTFTQAQFDALNDLLDELKIHKSHVVGHNKVNPQKTCPNFDVQEVLV